MLTVLFLAAAAAVVGLIVYTHNQSQQNRFAQLGAVACGVCGSEGVTERGGGSYRCGSCGYDTDAEQTPEKARVLEEIQELAIALTCLESADREFHESRHRVVRSTRSNNNRKTENVGPFHDRYLEGMEQAEEACQIMERQVDDHPALGPGIHAISRIPTPADGRAGFNERVSESQALVAEARRCLTSVRTERVMVFRA